jgi:hypothetical protein
MILVKENFLPGSYCDEMLHKCQSYEFPWFYFEKIDERYPESEWNKFYSHLLISDGKQNSGMAPFFSLVGFVLEEELQMKMSKVIFMRTMMYTSIPEKADVNRNKIELSQSENAFVALLFINENDGEAMLVPNQKGKVKLLENGEATSKSNIKAEKNKVVIFNDEYILHDMFPKKSRCKIVLQVIFEAFPLTKEKDISTV